MMKSRAKKTEGRRLALLSKIAAAFALAKGAAVVLRVRNRECTFTSQGELMDKAFDEPAFERGIDRWNRDHQPQKPFSLNDVCGGWISA